MESILITSETLVAFIKKAKLFAFEILSKEAHLQIGRSRFYKNNISYPLHFVAFESQKKVGYFHSDLYEIGLNKSLLYTNDSVVKEVLRHELAHYLTFIEFGENVRPHGEEFHSVCRRYGWQKEAPSVMHHFEEKTYLKMRRVQKLLDLSHSGNIHEAKNALEKARSMMVGSDFVSFSDQEEFSLKRVWSGKKASQKIKTIQKILRTFFVFPVINYGKSTVYLEVFGKEEHVNIADYITGYLIHHLESLWKKSELKGSSAKKSFFLGIASGYTAKDKKQRQALIVTENALKENLHLAYPSLSYSKRHTKKDSEAESLGKKVGKSLTIKKGLGSGKESKQISFVSK